jgi:hypothetical protein
MLKKELNFKKGIPNEYSILFSTRFVTKNIIDYIIDNTHGIALINTPEYSITTFLIDDKELDNDIYDIENRVKFFLNQIKPSIEQLPIKIYWFPTHFLKIIPSDKKSLDVNEINSACTIHFGSVSNSLIVIYRYEEAKKVLFHELIHLFSLDTDIPTKLEYKIRNQYNLDIMLPCSLAETYAEFMGCLLNIYYISKEDTNKFNIYLAIEQAFSLYQVNKILNFFNIYDINELNKLSSNTNLMTYYFLKTALLTHPNVNNFFYSLLENKFKLDNHHLSFFEKYLDNLQNIPKYLINLKDIKLDELSMRMTIVE